VIAETPAVKMPETARSAAEVFMLAGGDNWTSCNKVLNAAVNVVGNQIWSRLPLLAETDGRI
jgi:hypothetical protein